MVAISTGFLVTFGRTPSGAYDVIVLAEIIGYLLIGVLCLSAIWASDGSTFKASRGDPLTRLVEVTTARRKRYQFALKATIALTLALIVNIIFYAGGGHFLLLNTTVMAFFSNLMPITSPLS
ncbi:hypothetical protein EM6_3265 (plasmid) [Asticcacaulis excentricus]|uniref:Uncharacterized protein n=2 Tax=Asticcacaulis excentricus TaxID=78587 RepID=A0A3G9GBJ4_9CAUL|nr:hypothetical protein EM6_3265 [Asticcacaulis excentricus]